MSKEALQEEQRQIIRMLEDAVITESTSFIYLLIGKLSHIQGQLDSLSDYKEGWQNNED
jgi:hypothetical protein